MKSMPRNIQVERAPVPPIEKQPLEIVERKGVGHPDTLLDAIVEETGRNLCRYYKSQFGRIFHMNVDKGSLAGGRARVEFGGGEMLEPIYICVVGRATTEVLDKDGTITYVPYGKIALDSIKHTLKDTLRNLDPLQHVLMDYRIKSGSADLTSVFDGAGEAIPRANDTSFGVGFAPLSETEQIVFQTEHLLNSDKFKRKHPEVGEDIKVMGLRTDNKIQLTVAAAIIAKHTQDKDHYAGVISDIKNATIDQAVKLTDREVLAEINTADRPKENLFYLTITGTSAEMGDDAGVGRGNRGNGLITPCRPMSLEATAGKNPVNHTGKLYNVLAQRAAERIIKEEARVSEAYVKILSRIGHPLDQPLVASAELVVADGASWNSVRDNVTAIVDAEVASVGTLQDLLIDGKISLF
jgi:S-adenosylmethionine synthetase